MSNPTSFVRPVAAFAIVVAAGCLPGAAHAQTALHSTVFPADSARVRKGGSTNQRSIVDTLTATLAKLEMHVTTVPPGGSPHQPHRHVDEELLFVRRGVIDVLQDTVTRRAGPGSVVFMASNELHGIKNPGPDSATYLVLRLAPRER